MVERLPVRMQQNARKLEPLPPSPPPAPPSRSGVGFWTVVGIVVVVILAISRCSGSNVGGTTPTAVASQGVGNAQDALDSAVAAQSPPPVKELSRSSLRLGASRVPLSSREGLAGEMIYSQNCYDALGRRFTWAKLDECGGFDIEASLSLGDGEPAGQETEVAWFDGEAAAGRYLKAATAAGQEAEAADRRLADLQAQVGRRHKPVATPTPDGADGAAPPDDGGEPSDGGDNVDV